MSCIDKFEIEIVNYFDTEEPIAEVYYSSCQWAKIFRKNKELYRNNLKNREFSKEHPQNFCPERETIAERQGSSEDQNCEGNATKEKTDSSGCFGIKVQFYPNPNKGSWEFPFKEALKNLEEAKNKLLKKLGANSSFFSKEAIYRNNLKNREFSKKRPQNFGPDRATITERQGASEDQNFEGNATKEKTDSSGCFGIDPKKVNEQAQEILEKILNHPEKEVIYGELSRFGKVMDIYAPGLGGARYTIDEEFIGFLEPEERQ